MKMIMCQWRILEYFPIYWFQLHFFHSYGYFFNLKSPKCAAKYFRTDYRWKLVLGQYSCFCINTPPPIVILLLYTFKIFLIRIHMQRTCNTCITIVLDWTVRNFKQRKQKWHPFPSYYKLNIFQNLIHGTEVKNKSLEFNCRNGLEQQKDP